MQICSARANPRQASKAKEKELQKEMEDFHQNLLLFRFRQGFRLRT
jgi:hypothetical protein